jgi:predicted NBD/HSP70 family sugar kinase
MGDERTVGTPVLRRLNTASVLRAVRSRAPGSVRLTELVTLTGLTRPTVGQAVEDLVEAGWLQHDHPAAASRKGGRPAVRVSLRGRAAPVFGLDVGPHTVSAGIDDLAGRRLAAVRRSVGGNKAGCLLTVVDAVIERALTEAEVDAAEIAAVVVATPGIVDAGRILLAPSVPGWTSVNLPDHLRDRFHCPVQVENDANLAALAVASEHAGTLLAVQWGERLGAGVVIDGRLHRGTGAAGEIGFIRPAGRVPDTDDGRGPLERAIGAEAITERARLAARTHPSSALRGVPDAAAVFAAAAAGDAVAERLVDDVAGVFAQAIAPAVLVLAPDAIVIGGGVARAGSVLVTAITRHLNDLTLTPPAVEISGLAEDTVLTGALRLALDEVWHRLPA